MTAVSESHVKVIIYASTVYMAVELFLEVNHDGIMLAQGQICYLA
jgi:hypothetical protein